MNRIVSIANVVTNYHSMIYAIIFVQSFEIWLADALKKTIIYSVTFYCGRKIGYEVFCARNNSAENK